MKNIIRITSKKKFLNFLIIFYIALSVAASVGSLNILGFFVTEVVNVTSGKNDFYLFSIFLVLYLVLELEKMILKYFARRLINRNLYYILKDLRNKYSTNLMKLSYKEFNENKIGSHYSFYTNNLKLIHENGVYKYYDLYDDVFWAISALISLGIIFWPLVVIFIGLYVISISVNSIFGKYFQKIGEKFGQANNVFIASVSKLFLAYRDFYSLNKTEHYLELQKDNLDIFYQESKEFIKNQVKPFWLLGSVSIFSQLVFVGSTVAFIFFNFSFLGSSLTVGSFFTVVTLGSQALGYTLEILRNYASIASANPLVKNYDFIKKEKDKLNMIKNIESFKLENIIFYYENDEKKRKEILNNFNFNFEQGKKYAIVGPSGTGKSTIFKLMLGIENPEKGAVLLNDNSIKSYDLESLYSNISYIDKDINFFKDTIKNNIILDKKISEEKLNEIFKLLNIDFIDKLDKIIDEENDLSEGQKQKIALARVLVQERKILFLDEAMANIDQKSVENIRNNLFKRKDLTIIEISHQIKKNYEGLYHEIIKL